MKTLLIIDEDPEVKELWERIKSKEAFMQKRIQAIRDDADKAMSNYEKEQEEDMRQLAEIWGVKSKLPVEYDPSTHDIGINRVAGVVYIREKMHAKAELIKDVFTMIFGPDGPED